MKYYFNYEIQPQDVDCNRKLRLYTLENYLLNTAGSIAGTLGFGLPQLLPYGYTWVITHLYLEILKMPTHGDQLKIETWIEQNAHMLSTRNFKLYCNDELIGQAKSIWAVIDIQKRNIVNVFDLPMFTNSVDGEILPIKRAQRFANLEEYDGAQPHTITYSDVDYNNHCNSCKYLEIMLDTARPTWLNEGIRLDITYVKELYFEEVMNTLWKYNEDEIVYQQKNKENTTCCNARISKIEKISC